MNLIDKIDKIKSLIGSEIYRTKLSSIQKHYEKIVDMYLLSEISDEIKKSNLIALYSKKNDELKSICEGLEIDTKKLTTKESLVSAIMEK